MVISIVFIVLILALDQLSKWLCYIYLQPIGTLPIINGVLNLTYAKNEGAAFSILQGQRIFFLILTVIVVILILFFIYKNPTMNRLLNVSLIFICGGAVGNFIDRAFRGYVIDMIDFRLINFAIFNVADSFLVIGTILFSIYVVFFDLKPEIKEKDND